MKNIVFVLMVVLLLVQNTVSQSSSISSTPNPSTLFSTMSSKINHSTISSETSHSTISSETPHSTISSETLHSTISSETPHSTISSETSDSTISSETPHSTISSETSDSTISSETPYSTISSSGKFNGSTVSTISTGQTSNGATTFNPVSVTSVFWVQTILSIPVSTDITNSTLITFLENRLSYAYSVGYGRTVNTGRKKRAATNGVNTLYLVSATRPTSTQTPTTLVYYVKAPDFVSPSTVVSNMNQLSLQEMSLIMGYPVTTVATLLNPTTQSLSTDDKFWIFGAVFGSLAATGFIIWLVLFIYRRCLIPFDEPLITEKNSLDLESQQELKVQHIKEEEGETILPKLQRTEQSGVPHVFDVTEEEEVNVGYNQHGDFDRNIENRIFNQRIPQEIIIKHIYEDIELENNSNYSMQRNPTYLTRQRGAYSSSVRRHRHPHSKKRRKRDRSTIQEKEKEIRFDIRTEQSALPRMTTMDSIDDTIDVQQAMSQYLEPDRRRNIIFVKPVESDQTPNKDDDVIYPVQYSDKYPVEHIYPVYLDSVAIPDTTLNLVLDKETQRLEDDKEDMRNANLKKRNMRTLHPVPLSRTKEQ